MPQVDVSTNNDEDEEERASGITEGTVWNRKKVMGIIIIIITIIIITIIILP